MEIEKGAYIRTEEGYIFKNSILEHKNIVEELENNDRDYIHEFGKVVNSSKNILDLIEVGDFVNKQPVVAITRLNEDEICICVYKDEEDMKCKILKREDVETILTKEKYDWKCYEV